MALPTIFDACIPRPDVLQGTLVESEFAADLAQVLRGTAPVDYRDPVRFFANTHPTRGLKTLLEQVCHGLRGDGSQVSSIFRLDTNYGGGKTHSLIALYHVTQGMAGVVNVSEFLDPALLPGAGVRVAAFDGENADPANGRNMGDGIRAYTPWGEIAYQLNGAAGYEVVRKSDETGTAPGAETLQELFSGSPTLILMDELSIYLRKQGVSDLQKAARQLTAFLSGLFKAVDTSRNTVLVFTLAIGKDRKATDAYARENQLILDAMDEAESVVSRTATLLDPTEEDETVRILRRRLFSSIDDRAADDIVRAYEDVWKRSQQDLPEAATLANSAEEFRNGYPLHPELMQTLTTKTSTLANFQRVRGMLRLLARAVSGLWKDRPAGTYALHLWHINPGISTIRQEFLTKLGQASFTAALKADVAASEKDVTTPSLAEELDARNYRGMPPFTSAVARTVFIHSLAFNEDLKGVSRGDLMLSIVSPSMDVGFIEAAMRSFVKDSSYLDEKTDKVIRFLTEANLNQIIRHQEQSVSSGDIRTHLNEVIRKFFTGDVLEPVFFPAVPGELDDTATARPLLAVIGYEAINISAGEADTTVPDLVARLFNYKGSREEPRIYRNNVVFLVADSDRIEAMKDSMRRYLALCDLCVPSRLSTLADYQQKSVREQQSRAEWAVAVAVQQAYRHLYYPSSSGTRIECMLRHDSISLDNASAKPGDGQSQVVRVLTSMNKLRRTGDTPDNPDFIIARTPLKRGQISMAALREEFRRDPGLPVLVGDEIFLAGIRQGIEGGKFVYSEGELLYGKGDPSAALRIEENAIVMTGEYARTHGIWPRVIDPDPDPDPDPTSVPGTGGHAPSPELTPSSGTSSESSSDDSSTSATAPTSFSRDGLLNEALIRLWEAVREAHVDTVSEVTVDGIELSDAIRLIPLAQGLPDAGKRLELDGEMRMRNGGLMKLTFEGPLDDARTLREYLNSQLRMSEDNSFNARIIVTYPEGLDMHSDMPETIIERLSKAGSLTAYVTATARVAS